MKGTGIMTPQVKTGVGVIVIKERKILVGKRKGSHGEGMLAFPGGGFEFTDSSMYGCCEREVYEETGISCRAFSPDKYRDDLFTTFDILSEDGEKRYVTCYVLAEYMSGGEHYGEGFRFVKPVEPDKCEMWEWLTLKELISRVADPKQETWIPIKKVAHYLKLWG